MADPRPAKTGMFWFVWLLLMLVMVVLEWRDAQTAPTHPGFRAILFGALTDVGNLLTALGGAWTAWNGLPSVSAADGERVRFTESPLVRGGVLMALSAAMHVAHGRWGH